VVLVLGTVGPFGSWFTCQRLLTRGPRAAQPERLTCSDEPICCRKSFLPSAPPAMPSAIPRAPDQGKMSGHGREVDGNVIRFGGPPR
jgi:hypothetical protein